MLGNCIMQLSMHVREADSIEAANALYTISQYHNPPSSWRSWQLAGSELAENGSKRTAL